MAANADNFETAYRCALLRISIERGLRYYTAVKTNWQTFDLAVKVVSFALLCLSLLGIGGSSFCYVAAAALTCFLGIAISPIEHVNRWNEKCLRYIQLRNRLPLDDRDADSDAIKALNDEKASMDAGEKVIECLSIKCQDMAKTALGYPGTPHGLTLIQRTLGQFCYFISYK